jgi:hypothetical protein
MAWRSWPPASASWPGSCERRMSSSYIARRFVTGGLQLARPMQSMPTTSLASPATSSVRSDSATNAPYWRIPTGLAASSSVHLSYGPRSCCEAGTLGRCDASQEVGDEHRDADAARRAAALPEDPSTTVDDAQCDGAGELGLDGLSIGVESREQLAVRACRRWGPTTTTSRDISTCGRCRTPTRRPSTRIPPECVGCAYTARANEAKTPWPVPETGVLGSSRYLADDRRQGARDQCVRFRNGG